MRFACEGKVHPFRSRGIPSMGFSTGGVPWKSSLLASRQRSTRGRITSGTICTRC
jgi:hypothetical protein